MPTLGLEPDFIDDLAAAVRRYARNLHQHEHKCACMGMGMGMGAWAHGHRHGIGMGMSCLYLGHFLSLHLWQVQEALPRTALPVVSDINEGRPVSLRVVNDLVQLRAKEELIEYGPVNYEVPASTLCMRPIS